jgi:hypothetical protein
MIQALVVLLALIAPMSGADTKPAPITDGDAIEVGADLGGARMPKAQDAETDAMQKNRFLIRSFGIGADEPWPSDESNQRGIFISDGTILSIDGKGDIRTLSPAEILDWERSSPNGGDLWRNQSPKERETLRNAMGLTDPDEDP